MEVSIIMVNYNTLELTKNAIKSIEEKTQGITYEIILVDNNSQDGSMEYFQQIQKKNFKYIYSKENLGFGRANNLGYENSKGKCIFLLNTDTLLVNNAIKELYEVLISKESIGIVGGNLYDNNLKPVHSFMKNNYSLKEELKGNILLPLIKTKVLKRKDFNYSDEIMEVGYVTGADLMIKREVINKVGFFDPDFFMYYEETELTNRVVKKGYKVLSVPSAKIIHLEGKSSSLKKERFRIMTESKYKFYRKVYNQKNILDKSFYISQSFLYLRYGLTFDKRVKDLIIINKEMYKKERGII